MKASDTVMGPNSLDSIARQCKDYKECASVTAKAQADITWKDREPEIAEARRAGGREVVEIVEGMLDGMGLNSKEHWKASDWKMWEDKLRELGLDIHEEE